MFRGHRILSLSSPIVLVSKIPAYATLQDLLRRNMKAIVAMTRDRVIGKNNKIPWRLPGEQKWFKELTMGHPILMGRKTFESIGRPLPGRRNLIVTRTGNFAGADVIRDLNEFDPALYELGGREIFVIGGAEVYKALLDRCDTIYATIVKQEYAGDAYFPEFESRFEIAGRIRETPEFDILYYRRKTENQPHHAVPLWCSALPQGDSASGQG